MLGRSSSLLSRETQSFVQQLLSPRYLQYRFDDPSDVLEQAAGQDFPGRSWWNYPIRVKGICVEHFSDRWSRLQKTAVIRCSELRRGVGNAVTGLDFEPYIARITLTLQLNWSLVEGSAKSFSIVLAIFKDSKTLVQVSNENDSLTAAPRSLGAVAMYSTCHHDTL